MYQGSWYIAVIVNLIGKDKYLIEYQTLKTKDESEHLKEKADALYLWPCSPVMQGFDHFKLFEKVDAWYSDGWWVGLISRFLGGLTCAVYFWTTNEELELEHFNLRPRQEWIGGKFNANFTLDLQTKSAELPLKPRPGKLKKQNGLMILWANYFKGMKVAVKSEEEGDHGLSGPFNDDWQALIANSCWFFVFV
ncbi:protein AGENET DOMAIN (AGD)-CONTAINING P1-like [Actinidia eriantha]|uniref:protein AGENET DOMAIN (AGD)-CONTAINING P1-like n=1 Tax=Actinidia eriantha TaxID=165200 RepID=UPI0025905EAB|nr:protein AGENET DOMAIN (AGD)-CONTAINING P1-like [Actinidia eriantha]